MRLFGGKDAERGLRPGFREMKWGDPAPKTGVVVLDEQVDDKFCTLEKEDLTLAGQRVERIVYKFFQGRLSEVVVEIPVESVDAVLKELNAGWGRPRRPNAFIEDYFWHNGSHGVDSTSASFSRNPNTKAAILTIQSNYIRAKRNIAEGKEPGKL